MKRLIYFLSIAGLLCFGFNAPIFAADLIVEEDAVPPNYPSISDAITAATDGDRIFIKNRPGATPWLENLNIDKSVSLLAFIADGTWIMQGEITIQPAIGREITIIGMTSNTGSITASANSPVGTPTRVNVLSSVFGSGSITISGTNYISHVAGNILYSGGITTRYATITGNQVNGNIQVNDAASLTSEDTLYVVGNRLITSTNGYTGGRIEWNNNEHYFNISNNWIRSGYTVGMLKANQIKTGPGKSIIENNSIDCNTGNSQEGIVVGTVPAGAFVEVQNNAVYDAGGCCDIGIQTGSVSGFLGVHFNITRGFDTQVSGSASVTNHLTSTTFTLDAATGRCPVAECTDAGNPGPRYTDLDLTRNNMGTDGGSFHYDNFFPLLTGGARVYLVKTPRVVLSGSSINAEAESFDR